MIVYNKNKVSSTLETVLTIIFFSTHPVWEASVTPTPDTPVASSHSYSIDVPLRKDCFHKS